MSYDITCTRCKAPVTHECRRYSDVNEEGERIWRSSLELREAVHPNILVDALIRFINYAPEYGLPEATIEAMKKSTWYEEGDEDSNFLSQAVIYPLLGGKEDPRTFFAYLDGVMRAAGFDPYEVKRLAHEVRTKKQVASDMTSGGLLRRSEMNEVTFLPETGWTAGLSAHGIGCVTSRITDVQVNPRPGGQRAPWDVWVFFEGGGSCHFSRLLRVALWVKDAEGNQVWPLPAGKLEL